MAAITRSEPMRSRDVGVDFMAVSPLNASVQYVQLTPLAQCDAGLGARVSQVAKVGR
jgi:hypothetical protein